MESEVFYRGVLKRSYPVLESGKGVFIFDADGNRILDGMSGLWCVNVGYGQQSLIDAATRQLQELPYYNNFFQCSNQPAVELAKTLVDVTPERFRHVFFTNSGSESVDTALKIALGYHRARGEGNRTRLIGRERGYHGVNFGGMSVGGIVPNRQHKTLPARGQT